MIGSRELKKLLAQLQTNDLITRQAAASELGDLISADQWNENQYLEIMQVLTPLALAEIDPQTKETLFYTLSEMTAKTPVEKVDWEPLAAKLDDLPLDCLEYSLYVLGSSRNAKYLPRLKSYLKHSNADIRGVAADALRELEWSLSTSVSKAN